MAPQLYVGRVPHEVQSKLRGKSKLMGIGTREVGCMSNGVKNNLKRGLALAALASSIQVACAKSGDPQPIQSAPPSALQVKLRTCATKLTGKGQVVVRNAALVCRRNANDGTLHDVSIRPRYQIAPSSSSRIELKQTIAIRLHDQAEKPPEKPPEKPSETKSPERSLVEQNVLKLLLESCTPVINQIFQRSGLQAEHHFRLLEEGDSFAMAGPLESAKPRSSSPAIDRRFHMVLEFDYSQDKGIVLQDDPASTSSGPLEDESVSNESASKETLPNEAPSEPVAKMQFCGQIAMRVAENYGLTKGRDCQSLSEGASTSVDKSAASDVGLMKPGRTIEELGKVKLASDEIDEVFFPACGKMAKTLHQR